MSTGTKQKLDSQLKSPNQSRDPDLLAQSTQEPPPPASSPPAATVLPATATSRLLDDASEETAFDPMSTSLLCACDDLKLIDASSKSSSLASSFQESVTRDASAKS